MKKNPQIETRQLFKKLRGIYLHIFEYTPNPSISATNSSILIEFSTKIHLQSTNPIQNPNSISPETDFTNRLTSVIKTLTMIGSDGQKSSPSSSSVPIYNRSYTIHSTSTDFVKPSPNYSFNRSDSVKKFPDSIKGKVRNLCNLFESRRATKPKPSPDDSKIQTKLKSEKSISPSISNEPPPIRLPGTEDRVVVYFTSLRGIRRTYEDCYTVRMILKFFRVYIDERDVSMDSAYRTELLTVLREKHVTLPQVFIKGKYVGGADVIKQLHETGQLAKLLAGLPVRSTGAWQVCDTCGDVRFVPCANCSGSKKVFDEDDDRLQRCPDCNENGLVRCAVCSS